MYCCMINQSFYVQYMYYTEENSPKLTFTWGKRQDKFVKRKQKQEKKQLGMRFAQAFDNDLRADSLT